MQKEQHNHTEETQSVIPEKAKGGESPLSVPAAIIAAGVIIAIAIVYSNSGSVKQPTTQAPSTEKTTQVPTTSPREGSTGATIAFRPISDADHIRGDRNAVVKVIEYSDLECPFCKRFHPTMQQVVNEYQGKVAWVYRHFPLDSLHPKARKEAEATECASELGGNEKFWAYTDRLFEVTPSNNNLDPAELSNIAAYVDLNKTAFEQCLASGKYASRVEADLQDAIAAGGRGTPYSVVVSKSGKTFPLSGALPYAQVKSIIDQALQN